MSKIVSVVGARPQFVKAAVVSEQLTSAGVDEVLIHTGQHYDANMSDIFFEALGIPAPRYNLGIGGGSHGAMTGRQLEEIERCLIDEKPAMVLVYGDTNSTLAGALAAVKLHIPVAHVEAGLRSFNMRMPEEVNRILTDRISQVLFTPSSVATGHLRAEGLPADRILEVGDVMYDAALRYGAMAPAASEAARGGDTRERVLVTIHRAENTDDPRRLQAIAQALAALGEQRHVIFPVHPRTRQALTRLGVIDHLAAHVTLTEPMGYIEMLAALRDASLMVTDSGGVQKEAYFLGTPCLTLRDETEWVETVSLGWNTLVRDLTRDSIVAAALAVTRPAPSDVRPYGDGRAAERIATTIARML